jgi:prepilin-type N-terminal cleavage/methylation domain-containing protein
MFLSIKFKCILTQGAKRKTPACLAGRQDVKGFSLIEVAIALALLALFFGGMLGIFERGAIASRKTQERTVAHNLARAAFEQYASWSDLDGLDGTTDGVVINGAYPLTVSTLNNIAYTPVLTIANGPIFPLQLKQLSLAITWASGTFTISTLKADY